MNELDELALLGRRMDDLGAAMMERQKRIEELDKCIDFDAELQNLVRGSLYVVQHQIDAPTDNFKKILKMQLTPKVARFALSSFEAPFGREPKPVYVLLNSYAFEFEFGELPKPGLGFSKGTVFYEALKKVRQVMAQVDKQLNLLKVDDSDDS